MVLLHSARTAYATLALAPPRLSPRRRLSFAPLTPLTPLAHSLCLYARSRPRSLWSHGLLSGVANAPILKLMRFYNIIVIKI